MFPRHNPDVAIAQRDRALHAGAMQNQKKSNSKRGQKCFVYVLGSNGKGGLRTYVGWTLDLERRLNEHNTGTGARSTRGRIWILLHAERFATRRAAMSREWYLKRDRRFRKRLMAKQPDI